MLPTSDKVYYDMPDKMITAWVEKHKIKMKEEAFNELSDLFISFANRVNDYEFE